MPVVLKKNVYLIFLSKTVVGGGLVETVPGPAAVVSTVTALSWWGDAEQSRRDVGGS